jgi:hypothetical protein
MPLLEPNFSALSRCVVSGIEKAVEDQFMDDDFKHYVYEAAVEAVYGKDFWKWRNKQEW